MKDLLNFVLQAAVPAVGDAREDWRIIRALSEVVGKTLPYDSLDEVRKRLADVAPHMGHVDHVESPLWLNGEYFKVRANFFRCHHCTFDMVYQAMSSVR